MMKTNTILVELNVTTYDSVICNCMFCGKKLMEYESPYKKNKYRTSYIRYLKCNSCGTNYMQKSLVHKYSYLDFFKIKENNGEQQEIAPIKGDLFSPPISKKDPINVVTYENDIKMCQQCSSPVFLHQFQYAQNKICLCYKCNACNLLYLDKSRYNRITNCGIDNTFFKEIKVSKKYYDVKEYDNVTVYKSINNTCKISHPEKVTDAVIKMYNVRYDKYDYVNAFHCNKCNKNFITYEAISDFNEKLFIPLCKCEYSKELDSDLKDKSILNRYGYTVKDGTLSDNERHRIIDYVIDNKIMSRMEVISLLQYLIIMGNNNSIMKNAINIWYEDIKYLYETKKERSNKNC